MASKFTITAELSLQTKNLNQVVRNLQSQFNNANLNIKIKDLAQAQSHIQKISASSRQASKDVGVLGNSMEQAFKRFTVITAVTGTLIAFTRALKNSVSDAISFEREVVKIAQATNQTVSQLRGLTNEINTVSTTFGVASEELILAARSLTQAGFAADKVAGSLKILAQTELAATFDSIQDTTEGAIALLNQFGRQAQKTGSEVKFLEQSFSAINQVSKEFAVESADLVTAIRTTGSAFEAAGGNLNELLALFTSVRSTTRESAESIATGFRTIFTRVQRVDTINALRNLGIELQDAEGKFIGPLKAVERLSTALTTIDPKDFRFNLVVEELGGFRQVSKVIPLIQQFAVTQQALNVAQNSSGSLAKDAQTAQQALAVQIAKTREEFQKFIREMVATDTFQSTVRTLLDLASAFIKVADSVKPLIPLVATFAAVKAGTALVPALRSFGGNRRGGIPIGFASGGLVPGSGNGDTVPAMLSPGEFVIRKSSVNKIGAANLAKMNGGGLVQRFASGGEVQDIPRILTQSKVGAAVLEAGVAPKTYQISTAGMDKVGVNKTWDVVVEGLSPESFDVFRNGIEEGLVRGLEIATNKASSIFTKDLGLGSPVKLGPEQSKEFLSTINRSAYGNLFEQVLTLNKTGKFANDDPTRPFDFENGIDGVLQDDYRALAGIDYVDAKASFQAASEKSLAKKIKNTILNEREGKDEYTGDTYLESSRVKAIEERNKKIQSLKQIAISSETFANSFDFQRKLLSISQKAPISEALAGDLSKPTNVTNFVKYVLGESGKLSFNAKDPIFNLSNEEQNKVLEALKNYKANNKYFGGVIRKFASGGFASGTDTVPAMLTPGEFVVNKKSAQRIGYSNLNRMNKVGKYASGGIVSGQQFVVGGKVGSKKNEEFSVHPDVAKIKFSERASDNAYFDKASKILQKDNKKTDYEVLGDGRREVTIEDLPSKKIGKGISALLKPALFASIEQLQAQLRPGMLVSGSDYIEGLIGGTKKDNVKYDKFINKSVKIALLKFRKEYEKTGSLSDESLRELGAYFYKSQGYSKEAIKSLLDNTDMTSQYENLEGTMREFSTHAKGKAGGWYQAPSILNNKGSLYIDPEVAERSSLRAKQAGRNVPASEILGRTFVHELEHNAMSTFLSRDTQTLRDFYNDNRKEIVEALEKVEEKRGLKLPYGHNLEDIIRNKTNGNVRTGIEEIFTQIIQFADVDPKVSKILQKAKRELYSKHLKPQYREKGGSIFKSQGTDTVPAMLTPGEFVINKKSAQRIGYGNLNRMNKAAKFANGGVVGKTGSPFDPAQQRMQASLFLGQYGQIVNPRQAKLLEGVINGMINAGLDAEKAMKQMAKDIDVRKRTNLLANYLNSPQDVKEKRSKYIGLAREGAAEKRGEAAKASEEYIAKLRELSDNSGKAITNMLILAGVTETLVSQYTSLSQSYKAGASAFGASLAIYTGITSQLKSFATGMYATILESKKETAARTLNTQAVKTNTVAIAQNAAVNKLQKSFNLLDGALTGFSVAMAVAAGRAAYLAKEAELASKGMSDTVNKFKEDFKSVSQAQLKEAFSRSFLTESRSKMVGEKLSSRGAVARIGAGASTGAAIGGAFGGAPGALFGGIVGGLAALYSAQRSFQKEFEAATAKISNSATTLADTLYQTSKSIIDVKKFIDEAKDKNLVDVFAKTKTSVEEYGRNVDSLNEAEVGLLKVFKTFGEIPEVLRNSLDDGAKSVSQFKMEIDKLLGLGLSKALTGIGSNIGVQGIAVDDQIQSYIKSIGPDIASLAIANVQQRYSRTISGFDQSGINTKELKLGVDSLGATEAFKEILSFKKQLAESTLQVINQNIALAKETKIREALLGVLSKQLALESQISNTNYSLETNAQTSRAIEAIYNGIVSGLPTQSVSSSILDVKDPAGKNRDDFNRALNIIGSFSPLAQNVQQTLREFSKVTPNLDMLLESINFQQFEGEPAAREQGILEVLTNLGVDRNSQAASGIADAFRKSFDVALTGAKEGGYTRKERQDLVRRNISDFFEEAKNKIGKPILEIGQQIESATREYRDKILQSQQKEIEARLSAVDSQRNVADLIQRANTGKGLTVAQNDVARFEKQRLLAGNLAGNPAAIGGELSRVRGLLKNPALSGPQQQALQGTAKKLEMALADLADQSSRTSDVMAKIDEIRAQRETLSQSAKDYAFGTAEEKTRINESFNALKTVLNFGDINAVSDELKGSVRDLLTRFKDIPLFNGMTGFQVENEIAAREFQKGGNFEMAAMLRSQTSSPEQKLIAELKRTSEVEMAARAQMLNQEQIYQQENTKAIVVLTDEIRNQGLNALAKQKKDEQAIGNAQKNLGAAPDEALLNRDLKLVEAVVQKTSDEIGKLGTSIEALNKKINAEIANLSKIANEKQNQKDIPRKSIPVEDRNIIAQGNALGGLIYKAGGGTIFKPRGTDTVPAMLTPGEYVVRKQAVDQLGVPTLDAINAGYFARGGKTRVARSQSGLERTVTDVRGYDRRAERMRRESPQYAAAYSRPNESSLAAANLYKAYNADVPRSNELEKTGEFIDKLQETAKVMNGMSMTHRLTVDGQLNIGGIDGAAIAKEVTQALGKYVGEIVQQHLNRQNRRPAT